MTDLLTTRQVQDLLRVDRTTIYRMVETGRLPAMRVGKQWRFARAEVERWLKQGHTDVVGASVTDEVRAAVYEPAATEDLAVRLPLACAQLILDAFAEILGVTMVITDMQGQPVTQMSNPCEFFSLLIAGRPQAIQRCVATWQQMAGAPALEPRFAINEMGLLCARGLIHIGAELKGMVVIGGIAPDNWPPSPAQITELGAHFDVTGAEIERCVEAVFRLDHNAQARVLRYVQRIADIFSHILEDRTQMMGRLEAATALLFLKQTASAE